MQIFCSSSHWWGTCLTYSRVSTCAGRIFGTAIHSKVDTWTVIEYLVKKKMKSPEPNNVCLCLFNSWVDLLQLLLPTDAIQSTDSSCTLILCQTPIPFQNHSRNFCQRQFSKGEGANQAHSGLSAIRCNDSMRPNSMTAFMAYCVCEEWLKISIFSLRWLYTYFCYRKQYVVKSAP